MADSKVSHSSSFFSSPLSVGQLVDVIDLLKRSGYPETRWQDLGLRLGLHKNTLDVIKNDNSTTSSQYIECLFQWLRKVDNVNSRGGATFDSLSDALRLMDETAVADKLDQERRNAMATCIFDTHCHNLSQCLCDPVSVAWMLYGERVLVRQAVTTVESGSPFITKQREALLDVLKEVIQFNYKNLQTFAIVLCKFPRNIPLGEAIHTDYDECFPSNKEFIKVRIEEDSSSSRATLSTNSTSIPTGPVEIPIRKSMSANFSSIRICHGRMMYNVRKAIRNHQVDFDELIDFTISCSSDIEEKLDKSSDVASVIRVIEKKECSLIDISLISAVVEEFRVTEAERYIEDYKEKLKEFCQSISVTLCLKEKFEANSSLECETATYVFDWRPDEKKLKDITDILSKTSGKFVKIKFIDTGYSIVIFCSFPHFLIGALITKLIENLDVLVKKGLKKVTIGCCLIWERQKLEEREQLLEEDIDRIKANQGDISEDPYDLQNKKKQLTADSNMQSIDTSSAIVTSQLKKEKETNKRLEEKLQKVKEKHCIQHMLLLTNTSSALSRIRRGMRMEIEELILYLTATKSDLQDQNAVLAENKREMEYLQDQISSTSVQLLIKREENEAVKADIKKKKQVLSNQLKLLYEKDEVKKKNSKILRTDKPLIDQPWFHGELSGDNAEMLLDDYRDVPGAFLVRECPNYIISFIYQQVCNHVMVYYAFREEMKMHFYLENDHDIFESISELIEHYHRHQMRSHYFKQKLTFAVPKIDDYEARPWFNNVSIKEAEDMLDSVSLDGAFLVRPSSQESVNEKKGFAITLRVNNRIHHIRIIKDGEQFIFGQDTFYSLIELIYYYKYYPIYLDKRLTHPIKKEILEQKNPHLNVYKTIKEPFVTVCASYDFEATRADELLFERGAIITNVEKVDGGWWHGEYKGSRGWFPANHVEEIRIT